MLSVMFCLYYCSSIILNMCLKNTTFDYIFLVYIDRSKLYTWVIYFLNVVPNNTTSQYVNIL